MFRFAVSLISFLMIFPPPVHAQNNSAANPSHLTGRISSGWNYYSKPSSFSPELNSLTNYINLNYRFFDPAGKQIRYQIKLDAYQKTGLTTKTPLQNNNYQNRYIIRQLYAAYGNGSQQIKLGRVVPYTAVIDAHPINGLSVENYAVLKSLQLSGFGGTINDYYKNKIAGSGYNTGVSAYYIHTIFGLGAGFTAEKLYNESLQKAYLYGEIKPLSGLRLNSKTMYITNKNLIGYSYTSIYYRLNRKFNIRTGFEYRNRITQIKTLNDTLSTADKYFYTANEKDVSITAYYQAFYFSSVGALDIIPSAKKRIGYDDLTYGNIKLLYKHFFFFPLNLGLEAGYTDNNWLRNMKLGGFFNKDFFKGKIDFTLSYYMNSFQWINKVTINNRVQETTSSANILSLASIDMIIRASRAFYASMSVTGEFGNAFDPRTSMMVRLNYVLR